MSVLHYDPCVANKMIQGAQCTICWYVDDIKISHKNPDVVSDVINQLERRFGQMTAKRGHTHTFVGMDFEITENGNIKILMDEYINECIEAFEEVDRDIAGKATTPSKHDLFEADESKELLECFIIS